MAISFIEVVSRLYKAGVSEDGEDFIAERFCVVAELSNGQRFEHCHFFNGARYDEDEWGWGFVDVRKEAKAEARKLARQFVGVTGLDFADWFEVDPQYGSQAYQLQGA